MRGDEAALAYRHEAPGKQGCRHDWSKQMELHGSLQVTGESG